MKGDNRTYVLDSSVLLDDPEVFYKLGRDQIIIPTAVIKEIAGIKRNANFAYQERRIEKGNEDFG